MVALYLPQTNSHDVGLVNSGDLPATFLLCQSESILCNPKGVVPGDDFEALHNPWYTLEKIEKSKISFDCSQLFVSGGHNCKWLPVSEEGLGLCEFFVVVNVNKLHKAVLLICLQNFSCLCVIPIYFFFYQSNVPPTVSLCDWKCKKSFCRVPSITLSLIINQFKEELKPVCLIQLFCLISKISSSSY